MVKELLEYQTSKPQGTTSSEPLDDDLPKPKRDQPQLLRHLNLSEKSKTPILDNFGKDLTELAAKDKLDPVIGRQKEIDRVAQILTRRKKNNPILIGEPELEKLPLLKP